MISARFGELFVGLISWFAYWLEFKSFLKLDFEKFRLRFGIRVEVLENFFYSCCLADFSGSAARSRLLSSLLISAAWLLSWFWFAGRS